MDLEGANFIVAPTHGLEGGVVIAQLTLTAQEVLTLKDSHAALSVVLQSKYISQSNLAFRKSQKRSRERSGISWTHGTGNRPEGGQPLNVIGVAAPEGITLGVLSPLQHKLLSLEGGVLVTHPAEEETKNQVHCFRGFETLCLLSQVGHCTYAPLSTLRDLTVSKPNSITLQHSEVNSWRRPWKHSSSKTMIYPKK